MPKLYRYGETVDQSQPSTHTHNYWIYAERLQGDYPASTERVGKWMVFPTVSKVDHWWAIIKQAVEAGTLGSAAKVATARPNPLRRNPNERVICVYTYDCLDKDDVMRIRATLRDLGVTWPISYKLDSETLAGHYGATGYKVSLYWE